MEALDSIEPASSPPRRKRFPWGCVVTPTILGGLALAYLIPAVQQAHDAARMAQLH